LEEEGNSINPESFTQLYQFIPIVYDTIQNYYTCPYNSYANGVCLRSSQRKLNLSRRKSQHGINGFTVQDGECGVEDPGRHITGNYIIL